MVIDEFAAASSISTAATSSRRISSRLPQACSAGRRRRSAASSLWGIVNGVLVFAGYADLPFVSLALGLVGAAAVVAVAALMAKTELFRPLRYCGATFDRHLSRLLPADGRDARSIAAQDRHHHRPRHDLAARDGGGRGRRARAGTGRCAGRRSASCSSGRTGRGSRPSGGPPCSRRNNSQHAPFRIDSSPATAHIRAMPAPQSQVPAKSTRAKPAQASPRRANPPTRCIGGHAEGRRPPLPGRRLRLHLPRLSRAAAAHPQVGRAAGQRRARLLQHAVEAADAR